MGLKKSPYDGTYYAKIQATFPIVLLTGITNNPIFIIGWGCNAASVAGSSQFINNYAEFNNLATAFKQWRVTGMSY